MNNWKETAKEVGKTVAGIVLIGGVCALLGYINPMLIATDGFVESMTDMIW